MNAGAASASMRHAERVRRDLELLVYPRREWLPPRKTAAGAPIYDAVIVGAGQGGLAAAFGLLRERVKHLLVIDENPLDRAGPWLNFARMLTLRTPKYLTGPDLGIPSLTPRAWYEAMHGEGSWESLGLMPKETWAAYLAWYRETLGIPVQADTQVGPLSWNASERAWDVPCTGALSDTVHARRVILATGIDGSGYWHVPKMIEQALPRERYAHTRWPIDFSALSGKRVAIVGCGASAFDNASTALEHGAAEVTMFVRRRELVRVNPYRWAEFVGFLKHAPDLPDADKWRFIRQILLMGQLPPADTYRRATRHANFHLRLGSAIHELSLRDGAIDIMTESGGYRADYLIVGTGFVTDLARRKELSAVEQDIARWADRYDPPEAERHDDLARHPYLGPGFEFTEREPGKAPHLRYLYNYTFGCLLSMGFSGASISGMKYSIPRLAAGVTGSLFLEDREAHYRSLCGYDEKEIE